MYDHVYPFVFLDSYQFFVYGSYQVYCGYAVRRKIRYGIAFFLGLYRDHAGGRRDPVWNFPYLFRSRTSGRIAVSVAFGRADYNLECNELSHCNQRLQRNHAVIYSCYCDHIFIRLGIADAGNSPCGSSSDCSGCGIRSDAFVGCDPFVSVFSTRGKGCLPFPKMGGSVSASGIYRFFYQYWTVCPFGDHVGRTASGTGAGTVCWCTLP